MSNYKNVYFRINTPVYYKSGHGVGYENQEDKELFRENIKNIFLNDNWEIKIQKYSSGCDSVVKDKQELYLHPQEVTGVILEENISYIENLLSNSKVFSFNKTDIYDTIFDITDEEYLTILEAKKSEIENDLLEIYKTKRSNLYITDSSPISQVMNKYSIKRLSHYKGMSTNAVDWKYVADLFENLVSENRILSAKTKHGEGYRTKTEKEKKKSA